MKIPDYFVIVSGENITLARCETEALLKVKSPNAEIKWQGRLGLVTADVDPTFFLTQRAAYVKEAGKILVITDSVEKLSVENLKTAVKPTQSFCVRTFIVHQPRMTSAMLAEEIGRKIKFATTARVSFEQPDVRILAIDLEDYLIVGHSIKSNIRKKLQLLKPKSRFFFHPSLMNTLLARAMCNLAQVLPEQIVLDPFCGAGGILCEAASLGAKAVGVDLNWKLLRGAKMNLLQFNLRKSTLIRGDTRKLPISFCDRVVTDPPYGRVSSTQGEQSRKLVEFFLEQIEDILPSKGKICICGDSRMHLAKLFERFGHIPIVRVQIRVHKTLIRELLVFEY